MTQVEDESDDVVWRAQILLEHRRRRKLHVSIIVVMLFVILVMGLTPPPLLALIEIDLFGEIGRNGFVCCFLPLIVPLMVVDVVVWRCLACGALLGRSDPQFCPHCGVQLQFLDE